MKILVHICCSIDSHYYLRCLRMEHPNAEIIGYFYDPNIHPKEEYELRFLDVARSCYKLGISLLKAPYDDAAWLAKCSPLSHEPERGKRCDVCFDIRLSTSASAAKFLGANALATTLSCSPKKDLNQLGASARRVICAASKRSSCELFDLTDLPTAEFINECKADSRISIFSGELEFLNPDYRQNGGTQAQMALAKNDNLYHQNYCGCAFALSASRDFTPELFSSASAEILPNSPASRAQVFAEIFQLEKENKTFNLRKNKILNYRLLHAKVLQNKIPTPAAILFYSHFLSKRALLNLNSLMLENARKMGYLGDDIAGFLDSAASDFSGGLSKHPYLLRANKDDICVLKFSALKPFLAPKYSCVQDWLRTAPSVELQLQLRAMINPGSLYDLSPIIVLDELGGKLEIIASSHIYADSSLCIE